MLSCQFSFDGKLIRDYNENHDVCFLINDQKIEAHKYLLCIYSKVFKKMLYGDMKEKDVSAIVLDHDPIIFKYMIAFMYTLKISCTFAELVQLTNLADYYEVRHLYETCKSFIDRHTDKENVYALFKNSMVKEIKDCAEEYIYNNALVSFILYSEIKVPLSDVVYFIDKYRKCNYSNASYNIEKIIIDMI